MPPCNTNPGRLCDTRESDTCRDADDHRVRHGNTNDIYCWCWDDLN